MHTAGHRRFHRVRRWLGHNLLHLDDTPHRIALGAAIGLFVSVTPTPFMQTLVALGLCQLFRANKAASLPGVWWSNPITFFPINWINLGVGSLVLRGQWEVLSREQVAKLMPADIGIGEFFANMIYREFWLNLWNFMLQFGAELWVGSLIQGFLTGLICYYPVRWAVVKFRAHKKAVHDRRVQQRSDRKAQREPSAA